MLTRSIRSGILDVEYSREHSTSTASNRDTVPELPSEAYFVPGEAWKKGQWVRLVFEKTGRGKALQFICVGTLVSASDSEATVERVLYERGNAPDDFALHHWRAIVKKEGDDWNVTELTGERDHEKAIALMRVAITKGNLADVEEILDGGLPLEHALGHDGTPLVLAAKQGQDAIVKMLLARGANVNARSSAGALYEVARRGKASLELLAVLRTAGATTPEEIALAAAPVVPFPVGAEVRHPKFGAGTIVVSEGTGEALKVTVKFEDGTSRALLAKYLAS